MIQFDLPKEQSSIIKVVGMGGGGGNAVNHMYEQGIEGVDFIICNTDAQALEDSPIPNKVYLGPNLTNGLGAGANPDVGRQAAEESMEELRKMLEVNTKMVFITAGMGGGTGTGGAPIIAQICRELGVLTVGIVTSPFSYEGRKRMKQAEEGIRNLQEHVDTLLVISNDKLRAQFGDLPFRAAFAQADNVLATAARCITDIINIHGVVNVDFADVSTAMRNGGVAILGSASAEGENRAEKAITEALASPLLNDNDIKGAQWILLNIVSAEGENEHTIDEMDTIQAFIQEQTGDDSDVILGMGHDNTLEGQIKVTVIATGFEQKPVEQTVVFKKPEAKKTGKKIVIEIGKKAEEDSSNQGRLPFKEEEDPRQPVVDQEQNEERMPSYSVEPQRSPQRQMNPPVNRHENQPPASTSHSSERNDSPERNQEQEPGSGNFLKRPSQIYKESPREENITRNEGVQQKASQKSGIYLFYKKQEPASEATSEPGKEQRSVPSQAKEMKNEEPKPEEKPEIPNHREPNSPSGVEDDIKPIHSKEFAKEMEEQRKKVQERRSRLKAPNFDINQFGDPYEIEEIPAYIRQNVPLQPNKEASKEDAYSGYYVKKSEDKDQVKISTINTFLDGKRPD